MKVRFEEMGDGPISPEIVKEALEAAYDYVDSMYLGNKNRNKIKFKAGGLNLNIILRDENEECVIDRIKLIVRGKKYQRCFDKKLIKENAKKHIYIYVQPKPLN